MLPDKETALLFHRLLAQNRALNAIVELERHRIEGPVLTGIGAEGICVGVGMALHHANILKESVLHGTQRTQYGFGLVKNLAHPEEHDHRYEILKNYALVATSSSQGEDGNIHWGCLEHGVVPFATSDMGRMVGVVLGIAEEMRRLYWPHVADPDMRPIAIADFGEGALNQGCIAEAFNWVAASNCRLTDAEMKQHAPFLDDIGRELRVLRGAPMIFIVNRNQFAIYTDPRESHGRSNIAARAHGYGNMRGVAVHGWDVFDVYEKVLEAVRNAQHLVSTLVDAETFRLTGHNADQISRKGGMLDEGEIRGLAPEEFKRAWALYDPLKNCRESVIAWGYASSAELENIEQKEMDAARVLFERAFTKEPEPTLEDRHKKTMLVAHEWEISSGRPEDAPKKRMRYNEALFETLRSLLQGDERVTVFGEDIHLGGVLGETINRRRLLSEEFGERRVHSTPISEEIMTAVAAGRGLHDVLGGWYEAKPIIFYQFAPFWADSYPAWRSIIAPNYWQKGMKFDLTAIFPFGVVHDGGSGEYHESCVEAPLLSMGGIIILFPSNARELAAMLRAAHGYPGPVAMFLQIYAFGNSEFAADVSDAPDIIPFGSAKMLREGRDVSVLVYGAAAVSAALNEAEFLARDGVDVEVVDVRCLEPLDVATLAASAKKTGRVIIMHEATWRNGGGIFIAHRLDEAGATEYSRTGRTAHFLVAEDNPIPTKIKFLWSRLPFEQYVVRPEDNFGDERTILRSSKLASLARELKEAY